MPAKKKRQYILPEKVGKMRQYLADNFAALPDDMDNLKNGHLLFIHTVNGRCIGKTINTVIEKFPCSITYAQVNSLLNKAKKLKDVSSDKGMNTYSNLCSEAFTLVKPQPMEAVSSTPVSSSSICQEHFHLNNALPEKVGKMRQYLADNFAALPDDMEDLKNGHLLFIHTVNGRSIGKTINTVIEKFPCSITYAQVNSLLNKAKKLKDVSSDKGMNTYSNLCSEAFTLVKPQPMEAVSSTPVSSSSICQEHFHLNNEVSTEEPVSKPLDVSTEEPAPATPDKKTPTVRSSLRIKHNLTRLKKRLDYLSLSRSAMKETQRKKLSEMKSNINRLKLKLTVKDNKIRDMKAKFKQDSLVQELEKTKEELNKMRRNVQRLKTSSCSGCVSSAKEIEILRDELTEKNKTIHSMNFQTFS